MYAPQTAIHAVYKSPPPLTTHSHARQSTKNSQAKTQRSIGSTRTSLEFARILPRSSPSRTTKQAPRRPHTTKTPPCQTSISDCEWTKQLLAVSSRVQSAVKRASIQSSNIAMLRRKKMVKRRLLRRSPRTVAPSRIHSKAMETPRRRKRRSERHRPPCPWLTHPLKHPHLNSRRRKVKRNSRRASRHRVASFVIVLAMAIDVELT